MRNRKPKTFYATRGHLTASGATNAEAKANLSAMVDWACAAAMPVIESRFGLVLVIAASPNGYCSTVFNPADAEHGAQGCFGQSPQGDYGTALQSARMHAAQIAWAATVDDQSHVTAAQVGNKAGELLSWIAFQRGYLAAKSAGHDNGMAWRIAMNDPTLESVRC